MRSSTPNVFLCNGASCPKGLSDNVRVMSLNYLNNSPHRNVNLQLPRFVEQVFHLPKRVLDLLEIAAYTFAADRAIERGGKEALI